MIYVGLDVSSARVALCVMEMDGTVLRQSSVASDPEAIRTALAPYRENLKIIGLEAGPTTAWLARGLVDLGLPVVVIDATHAAATLRAGFRNKTDRNDARGIADLMRVGKFRPVHVKSIAAQRDRALLTVREQLRRQSLDLRNAVWSVLQAEGLKPPKLARPEFRALVQTALDDPALSPILIPLVRVIDAIDEELAALDRRIAAAAKANDTCRLLMTVPGVGPLVAMTFVAGVDDPTRFRAPQALTSA